MTETQNANRPGALIAMSGGVDSSVAAWLMQQKGYACTGITMRLTRNETLGQSGFHTCCSEKDIEDAAEVAYAMDIPYEVLDFTADFREKIIEKFIRVYEAGGTPNPCIDCNRYMKFDHLLSWAREHGMEYVVTGHYARVEQDEATGRWLLKKSVDTKKDQTYFLYNLTQEQMAHFLLPLGGRLLFRPFIRPVRHQKGAGDRPLQGKRELTDLLDPPCSRGMGWHGTLRGGERGAFVHPIPGLYQAFGKHRTSHQRDPQLRWLWELLNPLFERFFSVRLQMDAARQ